MEFFTGPPCVNVPELPAIRLASLKAANNSTMIQRLAYATRRRSFMLLEDWTITLDGVSYNTDLEGKLIVPSKDSSANVIEYDGASVPLPWLISIFTIGILRPLGVMLIASIVHDYAYKFGHLKLFDNEKPDTLKTVPISRQHADRLFRDIIKSVNRLPLVGFIAWLFVRLGWFLKIRFNGERYGGDAPIGALSIAIAIAMAITLALIIFGVPNVCFFIVSFYLFAYAVSVWLNRLS